MDLPSQPPLQIHPNAILRGPIFPEPIQVILVEQRGSHTKIIGKGLESGKVYEPILTPDQIGILYAAPPTTPFDGDATRFRLGIEATRIGLAYEYDPYFSLSIARIAPLPHQLEAIYDYFLKTPRVRFLLADDPGAGKTVMAGLLVKELKIRGLIKRILAVTPANLTFQWQREMKEKFHEDFEIVNSQVLRANYGMNPWQERNQVITSVSWISRIEDAKDSLLRSHWDLIIVDEAHKMSAYSSEHKTLAYQLGEALSELTDHLLLMTATPHKGDVNNFSLFLRLLDKDVYGDVKSLEQAIERNNAPFYLRRVKEALVTFPDPETGKIKAIFTKRDVKTAEFQIDFEEADFYDALTDYVDTKSVKAATDNSPAGRAVGFTMALLQRRFASSVYAVRRTLERMVNKRQKILDDPAGYRREQIARQLPEDFDELPESEQEEILSNLEGMVDSINPGDLREDIAKLTRLINLAKSLEKREVESKLKKLREVLSAQGIFADPKMKLLLFTEHKDTLDYLVDRLRDWGLTVTQIHGSMKIGDRDTPGTRIYAEREFREDCQVLVATEAAGEGINLQFCWFMINYDIPWNPVRLEQRMGRIHRYGQEKDCLIFNFVTTNTREGRVLHKLFERLHAIEDSLDPQRTGKIFNVLGDLLPANQLERMVRDMYAHNLTEDVIKNRIVEVTDPDRFRKITASTLEGLAKRELNLSAIIGKSAEAKERRLVPEVIEDFFVKSSVLVGLAPRAGATGGLSESGDGYRPRIYRIGRVPRSLWPIGDKLELRFGRLGREYKQVVFDKSLLDKDATLEWVTPGHALFETVRAALLAQVQDDMERGTIFYDLNRDEPSHLSVFSAAIRDGLGNVIHRKIFVVEYVSGKPLAVRQPTIFLDLIPAPMGTECPTDQQVPDRQTLEQALFEQALEPYMREISLQREKENQIIRNHLQVSLNELIHRQNMRFAELMEQANAGDTSNILQANLKQTEERIDELNARWDRRTAELAQERHCTVTDIQVIGEAWVLPHPDRLTPGVAPMVRDEEIERIAVREAIRHETMRGWRVESVESENRGFDLISRRFDPANPYTPVEVRFVEVKGRAGIGEVALSANEFKTAERLKNDYWLYVVYNCAATPQLHDVQNPTRLNWKPVTFVEHFRTSAEDILKASHT
jgi:superfamily II DNA or RNA helicase